MAADQLARCPYTALSGGACGWTILTLVIVPTYKLIIMLTSLMMISLMMTDDLINDDRAPALYMSLLHATVCNSDKRGQEHSRQLV